MTRQASGHSDHDPDPEAIPPWSHRLRDPRLDDPTIPYVPDPAPRDPEWDIDMSEWPVELRKDMFDVLVKMHRRSRL